MLEKYRGDTFEFVVSLEDNGQPQTFKVGDIVRFGMKKNLFQTDYDLYKQIVVSEETDSVEFKFPNEETKKLAVQKHHIEIELTRNTIVQTIYRDSLTVLGDVVND